MASRIRILLVPAVLVLLILVSACGKQTASEKAEQPKEAASTPDAKAKDTPAPTSGSSAVSWKDLESADAGSAEAFLKAMLQMSYKDKAADQLKDAKAEYSAEYSNRIVTIIVAGKPSFQATHNAVGSLQAWTFTDLTLPVSDNTGNILDVPTDREQNIEKITSLMAQQTKLPTERLNTLLGLSVEAAGTTNGMRMRSLDANDESEDHWNFWFSTDGRVEKAELGFGGN